MKTVSKKLLSLLLVAILLVSALPFQAFAEDLEGSDGTPVVLTAGGSDSTSTGTGTGTGTSTGTGEGTGTGTSTGTGVKTTTVPHDGNHNVYWEKDNDRHKAICQVENCEQYNKVVVDEVHDFKTGRCPTCEMLCPHQYTEKRVVKQATCTEAGATHVFCKACDADLGQEEAVAALGHTYDEATGKCIRCAATRPSQGEYTLTLDAGDGNIANNGGNKATIKVQKGKIVGVLPDAEMGGTKFVGWYLADGVTKLESGFVYNYDTDITAYAKYATKTQKLVVYRIINGNNSTATELVNINLPENTPLLSYLESNVKTTVQLDVKNNKPGYRWTNVWQDYSGKQLQLSQTDCMNQAWTVYVNYVPNTYTLYFQPNGGTVTPVTKTVTFGEKVGTLPTPYLANKVFQGWKDAAGNVYTAATVFQVAGDVSLTASWLDKANVMLYIYINGDFSGCNRILPMDDFVVGNNLSRADVVKELVKYYTPASGSLSVAGLFDEYTWGSYRANTSKAGTDTIAVSANGAKVYVMINNAQSGSTVIPTNPSTTPTTPGNGNAYWVVTGPNTGYWVQSNGTYPQGAYWVDLGNGRGYWAYNPNNYTNPTYPTYPTYYPGTNPKTGDTAQLEVAAAVMILAAAALVTMMALRKKRA